MSATPQWLLALERALRDHGVPVHEIVCGGGRLSITLGASRDALVVMVEPRSNDHPCWASTRRFNIGFFGARDLDDEQQAWLTAVLRALRQTERFLPATLDSTCGLFAATTSEPERFARSFPFCTVEHSRQAEIDTTEVLVRVTPRCNQACPFCSAPAHNREPSSRELEMCVGEAARIFTAPLVTLTGGEPTLRPAFLEEVRACLARPGLSGVQVQTNAVGFAERIAAGALAASERLTFFVSLHALDPAIYDACTGTRGQLEHALGGMRAIIDAGHQTIVNCVVNRRNLDHLLSYVDGLPAELPWNQRVELHFSVLMCPEHRPAAPSWLAPYREVAARLEEAAARARAQGLRVAPLRCSTHASMPACVLSPTARAETPRRPELRDHETGYDGTTPWTKGSQCRACVEERWCLGVPRAYAERLGLDELVAIVD